MASRILVVDDSPTIRRVVSAILERQGYDVALASDGQDALETLTSGEVKADLILLDFVMPRMNGFQFCRELRANAELAMLPVVLMSAKADRIRDQFVNQTGAIDAITKPFDAKALVAIIEHALRRVTSGRASSTQLPTVDEQEVEPAEPTEEEVEFETRRTNIAQIVATKLSHMVSRTLSERPRATPGELASRLTERLAKDAIIEMLEVVRELERTGDTTGPVLTGEMASIPIGAVLQLLQVENQTGVLTCRGQNVAVSATFRNGLIDIVQSTGVGDEFRLGRFFVEEGILSPEEIDEVMRKAKAAESDAETSSAPSSQVHPFGRPGPSEAVGDDTLDRLTLPSETENGDPPDTLVVDMSKAVAASRSEAVATLAKRLERRPRLLGSLLLEAGKITEAQLRSALTRQSSELLYEVLRWPKGRFDFRRGPAAMASSPPTDPNSRLGLPVASVVMEGFRRVDEWRVLERTLGSFDAVLVRDDVALGTLDEKSLPAKEKAILGAVDGERTVRVIVESSHMSPFDACRALVQFLEARILRRRTA
ncbi:Phosphate regulon transcriptional regulatory protein PhoB (SphR) [Labilithrix luteola]|uniref:Phosphate regulon transcriptional regulatory protein PhoB (SphR) n=1 Tax=Labilithrix luteola TaxID=1391654 RepID=A0A0K1PVE9_9BACT|nr:response regulator [Labilithrix luteola]AKU97104.1 Phosphate regulon transcriptional regulatory protein PhoB (SphR) [Labilithrix luteola]